MSGHGGQQSASAPAGHETLGHAMLEDEPTTVVIAERAPAEHAMLEDEPTTVVIAEPMPVEHDMLEDEPTTIVAGEPSSAVQGEHD